MRRAENRVNIAEPSKQQTVAGHGHIHAGAGEHDAAQSPEC